MGDSRIASSVYGNSTRRMLLNEDFLGEKQRDLATGNTGPRLVSISLQAASFIPETPTSFSSQLSAQLFFVFSVYLAIFY